MGKGLSPTFSLSRTIILGLLIGLSGVVIGFIPFVSSLEENIDLGLLFKLRGPRQPPSNVIIVNIDKYTADKLHLSNHPEKWPRSFHAALIDNLITLGARVIAFDVFFSEPTSAEDDTVFAKAIKNASNVILFGSLRREKATLTGEQNTSPGDMYLEKLVTPIPLFEQPALASAPFPLPRRPVKVSQYWTFKTSAGDMPTIPVVTFQLFALTEYDRFIQLFKKFDSSENGKLPQSRDEVIRSKSMVKVIKTLRDIFKRKPQIPEKMIEELEKSQFSTTDAEKNRILKSLIKIYQGPDSRYLNYFGHSFTIPTISFYEVLQFSKSNGNAESMYPRFHDKVVFIGSSGSLTVAQKDSFYTVFSEPNGFDLCGVEIAATAFANLLEDMPIQPLRLYAYFAIIFLWGLALGIFCLRLPSLISAGSVSGISALYLLIALHQFTNTGAWYPLIIPLFFQAPLAFFSALVCRYIETHKERRNIRAAFKYYIPDEIVDQLTKNVEGLKTHGQVVYGTCLSTDAEQYTSLSEAMSPGELGVFMNKYYETIFEPIRKHGGMITNVVGDAAMAIWIEMRPEEKRRTHACLSALDIERGVCRFNQTSPYTQLPTRIGLHSGQILLGNIGAGDHYEYRPVGDIVNTAARIEGLNKYLGTRILASEEVITQLDNFLVREIGKFLLVGKSKPLIIYELLFRKEESDQKQRDLCLSYTDALDAFKRQAWYEALEKFYNIIKTYGQDGPSLYFATLCKEYRGKHFGESWDGVVRMEKK